MKRPSISRHTLAALLSFAGACTIAPPRSDDALELAGCQAHMAIEPAVLAWSSRDGAIVLDAPGTIFEARAASGVLAYSSYVERERRLDVVAGSRALRVRMPDDGRGCLVDVRALDARGAWLDVVSAAPMRTRRSYALSFDEWTLEPFETGRSGGALEAALGESSWTATWDRTTLVHGRAGGGAIDAMPAIAGGLVTDLVAHGDSVVHGVRGPSPSLWRLDGHAHERIASDAASPASDGTTLVYWQRSGAELELRLDRGRIVRRAPDTGRFPTAGVAGNGYAAYIEPQVEGSALVVTRLSDGTSRAIEPRPGRRWTRALAIGEHLLAVEAPSSGTSIARTVVRLSLDPQVNPT